MGSDHNSNNNNNYILALDTIFSKRTCFLITLTSHTRCSAEMIQALEGSVKIAERSGWHVEDLSVED